MPFDNVTISRNPICPELAMLNDMAFELRIEGLWLKGAFGPPGEAHCIYGTLNMLDHGHSGWFRNHQFSFQTEAAANIHRQIIRELAPIRSRLFQVSRAGIEFNDSPETCHADVLRLIERLRTRFAHR